MHVIYERLFDLVWLSSPHRAFSGNQAPEAPGPSLKDVEHAIQHAISTKAVNVEDWQDKHPCIM